MKFIFSFLLLTFSLCAQSAYQPGTYKVDPAHSRVSFVVAHFVVSEVEGRFNDVIGEFTMAKKFEDSKLTTTVPIKSLDTAVQQRDEHLLSADFFDVDKYPEMKLVSKSIKGTPESFKMTADLTIKDVTKEVEFDCQYTGSVDDPHGTHRAAFKATAKINRHEFNVNYDARLDIGPMVGDDVTIRLWTEGMKL